MKQHKWHLRMQWQFAALVAVLGAVLFAGCGGGNGLVPSGPPSAAQAAGTYTGNFSLSNNESGAATLTINADGTASLTTNATSGVAIRSDVQKKQEITATGTYNGLTGLLALTGQIILDSQTLDCVYGGTVTVNGSTYTVNNGTISISNGVTGTFVVSLPTASITPAPGTTPVPGVTPSGPLPPTKDILTFFADGNFTNGQFVQTSGSYFRYTGTLQPITTTTPGPEATVAPEDRGTLYQGTYTLSNGDTGRFILAVLDTPPLGVGNAVAVGSPEDSERYQITTPGEQGTATVTVQISGNTGTGTVQLSNGFTGNITINSRIDIRRSSAALKQLNATKSHLKSR